MFDEGTILYFTTFYFNNPSATPKPKYFVVVKRIDHVAILAALPSSKKHLPYALQSTFGCIELPDSGIGCYVFKRVNKWRQTALPFHLIPTSTGSISTNTTWTISLNSTHSRAFNTR